jgi:hypothetical protein
VAGRGTSSMRGNSSGNLKRQGISGRVEEIQLFSEVYNGNKLIEN